MKEFVDFISKYGRTYGTRADFEHRFDIFSKTLKEVREHNQNKSSIVGFTKSINKFSDMADFEFSKLLGDNGGTPSTHLSGKVDLTNLKDLPESVDWRW